jgi:hypothetical protein
LVTAALVSAASVFVGLASTPAFASGSPSAQSASWRIAADRDTRRIGIEDVQPLFYKELSNVFPLWNDLFSATSLPAAQSAAKRLDAELARTVRALGAVAWPAAVRRSIGDWTDLAQANRRDLEKVATASDFSVADSIVDGPITARLSRQEPAVFKDLRRVATRVVLGPTVIYVEDCTTNGGSGSPSARVRIVNRSSNPIARTVSVGWYDENGGLLAAGSAKRVVPGQRSAAMRVGASGAAPYFYCQIRSVS